MVDKMWSEKKTPNIPCGRALVLRALRPENTREKGKSVSFYQHHAKCENVYLDLIRKFKPYILKSLLSVRFGWLNKIRRGSIKNNNNKNPLNLNALIITLEQCLELTVSQSEQCCVIHFKRTQIITLNEVQNKTE